MNVTFRIVPHSIKPYDIVEVMLDGFVCCTVCPGPDDGDVRIISAHFQKVWLNNAEKEFPPIPSIEFKLVPEPYHFRGGKLERETKQ